MWCADEPEFNQQSSDEGQTRCQLHDILCYLSASREMHRDKVGVSFPRWTGSPSGPIDRHSKIPVSHGATSR